jgi:hypothetical protein
MPLHTAGEKKHWQKKAQSLSKDVQRLMATGDDALELREENHALKYRIEVTQCCSVAVTCCGLILFLCGCFL